MCTRLTEELLVLQKNVIASKFEESAKKMDEKIDEAMRLQSVFLFDGIEEVSTIILARFESTIRYLFDCSLTSRAFTHKHNSFMIGAVSTI